MQELRQQCSERSPVVAIGKNAGVKMGNHLVRKRDLGLRPLAGPQRDVATRDLRVGALARGHGAALQTSSCSCARARLWVVQPYALWVQILLDGRATDALSWRGAATRH